MKILDLYEEDQDSETESRFEYKDTQNVKEEVFPLLQQKIEKMNRRAKKLGLPPIVLTKIREFFRPVADPHGGPGEKRKFYEVKVEGADPKVSGYKFLATIDHKDGGNVIRTAPGHDENPKIKEFYEARRDYCDHCRKKRFRLETFIIQDEQGNLRQIGRNCLADFMPGTDPRAILFYFSMRDLVQKAITDSEEEGARRGFRGRNYADLSEVMTAGAALIRKYGYKKSRNQDGESNPLSTVRQVRTVLFPPSEGDRFPEDKEWIATYKNSSQDDIELANKVLQWFRALPPEQKNSDFFHNIDVILKNENIESKDFGFVVALFPAYERAMGQMQDRQRAASGAGPKSNEWIGQPGAKIPPTQVKLTRVQAMQSGFGPVQLIHMEDQAGNLYVWFNNSPKDFKPDQQVTIVGTIKKHDTYNGRKQTVLTRVKAQ